MPDRAPGGAASRETVEVSDRAELRAWLQENHATSPGVWLVTWKQAAGPRYLAYEAVVEELLCFGWIDSQVRGVDALRTSVLCTPRRRRSTWSASNRARIARLETAGLLAPAGEAAVATARAEGTWDATGAAGGSD